MSVRLARARRSKYGALPTMVDGIKFASKAEARHYGLLLIRLRIGEIRNLILQPEIPLYVLAPSQDGLLLSVGVYRADFKYDELDLEASWGGAVWRAVVTDVKGMLTPIYRLKKRMVEAQYGIVIREVR